MLIVMLICYVHIIQITTVSKPWSLGALILRVHHDYLLNMPLTDLPFFLKSYMLYIYVYKFTVYIIYNLYMYVCIYTFPTNSCFKRSC